MVQLGNRLITNESFLSGWQSGSIISALLGCEVPLVESKIQGIDAAMKIIVRQKQEVTGGDDWHDGAFRATDSSAANLHKRFESFHQTRTWPVVEMPHKGNTVATIGSRIQLQQGKAEYSVDIVGMSLLHSYGDDDQLVVSSVESPIGKVLLGKSVGDQFEAKIGHAVHSFRLLNVIPSPDLESIGS